MSPIVPSQRGHQSDALYAKISCVEADVEKGSYSEAAQDLSRDLQNPVALAGAVSIRRC